MATPSLADTWHVYIGSYTKPGEGGISLLKMDDATGKIENLGVVAKANNPSFLAVDATGKFLYSIQERRPGMVGAYQIDPVTGKLTPLNAESAKGDGPCHIFVDSKRKNALVANYGGGNIACLPIKEDGSMAQCSAFIQHQGSSVNPQRQKEPHAHGIYLSPDEKYALATDLGTDKIYVYKFDAAKGTLEPHDPPAASVKPGAGVRHGTFSPDGKRFYAINELNLTITSFDWDAAKGTLTEIETVPTVEGVPPEGSSTAEIAFHPNGKVLYGSNRGINNLAIFAVDAETGKLTPKGHVPTDGVPRHFAPHPTGKWLLAGGQDTDKLTVFACDPDTGALTKHGEPVSVPSPVCIVFVKAP